MSLFNDNDNVDRLYSHLRFKLINNQKTLSEFINNLKNTEKRSLLYIDDRVNYKLSSCSYLYCYEPYQKYIKGDILTMSKVKKFNWDIVKIERQEDKENTILGFFKMAKHFHNISKDEYNTISKKRKINKIKKLL